MCVQYDSFHKIGTFDKMRLSVVQMKLRAYKFTNDLPIVVLIDFMSINK